MQCSPRTMARVALFTALCVAAAVFFRFGGNLVPFSLVPFVVFLSGFLLLPREAFLSMALYVLLGLLGFPVFATPPFGGPAYVFRPTFGFLLGFMLAAPCVAFFLRGKKSPLKIATAIVLGMAALYLPGILYFFLAMNTFLGKPMGFSNVLQVAFLPFIGPDFVKAFLAFLLAQGVVRRMKGRS